MDSPYALPMQLNMVDDLQYVDNTELVTITAVDGIGNTLATYANCFAIGFEEQHAIEEIDGARVAVVTRRWHVQAAGLVWNAGIQVTNPLAGVLIVEGWLLTPQTTFSTPAGVSYVIKNADLETFQTRWALGTQRAIT